MRVGWFERIALKHVYYHSKTDGRCQVQCVKQGTQSQRSRATQRNRVAKGRGRWVQEGRGRGGTHVYLWLIHADAYVKKKKNNHNIVIILQLNKLIKKINIWLVSINNMDIPFQYPLLHPFPKEFFHAILKRVGIKYKGKWSRWWQPHVNGASFFRQIH